MLRRPRYIGRVEWGHIHKTYKSGARVRTHEHRHDLVIVAAPQLRIVPDERWNTVQARCRAQETPQKKGGRPAIYLLSGVLRNDECVIRRVQDVRVRASLRSWRYGLSFLTSTRNQLG